MKKTGKVKLSPEENKKRIEEYLRKHFEGASVEYDEWEVLCESIEKTFFNGAMAFRWYRLIDNLIEDEGLSAKQIYYVFFDSYHKKTRKRPFEDCTESWLQPSIKKAKGLKRLQ